MADAIYALPRDRDNFTTCCQLVCWQHLTGELSSRLEGRAALQMDIPILENCSDRNPVRVKGRWRVPHAPGQIRALKQHRQEAGWLESISAGKALESWQAAS